MATKVLFILKYRENSDGTYSNGGLSSGLANSARYVCDMLNANGVEAALEHVIDNNCIDKFVAKHRPTHVIIEAYFVVPEKFEVLTRLHPNVIWVVRNHSELPFLSSEGIAIDWTCRYVAYENVNVSGNSPRVLKELKTMIKHSYPQWTREQVEDKVWYLPNYYKPDIPAREKGLPKSDIINVGCFGAIRPLKNQLLQAVAAIQFCEKQKKTLYFHVNSTRIEGGSTANALKNLRALFLHTGHSGHKLIEHDWLDHDKFIQMLQETIDIGMCVSHSETFCIVAADLVTSGIPIVTSEEVVWASSLSKADPNSSEDIASHLNSVWGFRKFEFIQTLNNFGLRGYCKQTIKQWLFYFAPEDVKKHDNRKKFIKGLLLL